MGGKIDQDPKDIDEMVKIVFYDWAWGVDNKFINDLKNKNAEFFALSFHNNVGRFIRNNYGLWKGNSKLYRYFVSIGITDPDEMSHQVFLEVYKYGRIFYKIED